MKPIKLKDGKLKDYSVSPYNFVSFPKTAVSKYENIDELPDHDSYKDSEGRELLNGIIEYSLVAETPILVSSGIEDEENKEASFFINNRGDFTIPGSTMRGMTRTNAQILSFSNVIESKNDEGKYAENEIEDSRYMYREIAGNNALSIKYGNELGIKPEKKIVENVKAGYIYRKNEKDYVIKPALEIGGPTNYFRIDEIELRKIVDKDIEKEINFMYSRDVLRLENKLKNIKDNGKRASILESKKNGSYRAYQTPISFNYDKGRNKVVRIGAEDKYSYNGYIVCSEHIWGKRGHFIIPEPDEDIDNIGVNKENISHYMDDLIRTKKMRKSGEMNKEKDFFALPKKIGIKNKKPIFYINKGSVLHFGFTPYLRVFYRNTVLDGVPESYKNIDGISYTDAIFGFSNKIMYEKGGSLSYKTRVSFEDTVVEGDQEVDRDSSIEMPLAEPKPTSYNLYLKQDLDSNKKSLDIYDDKFELRGIKQYWLKEYVQIPDFSPKKNKNMIFNIEPLKEGTVFRGKIHFNNLYKDELGLLIWALKLNDDCFQNIGLAKPYGFGRVKVKDLILKVENLQKKYTKFSFDYMSEDNIEKYIDYYKEQFSKKYLNNQSIDDMKPIKELMYIKSRIVKETEANNFRYMRMKNSKNEDEFKDKKVLPEILEQDDKSLKSKSKKKVNKNNNKEIRRQNKNKNKSRKHSLKNTMEDQLRKWQKDNI